MRIETNDYPSWEDKVRETFERDGSQLILNVGIEMAVNIKSLSLRCSQRGPDDFDEGAWREGLANLLGYHLPSLRLGESYKMVIVG